MLRVRGADVADPWNCFTLSMEQAPRVGDHMMLMPTDPRIKITKVTWAPFHTGSENIDVFLEYERVEN